MTDKRFNRVGGYVYDGDKCISHFEDVSHRDDIVTLLNKLHEENEQLKQQKQQYKGQRDYLLFVIERTCSKELFEETKSYLKEVE